eukprot:gene9738-2065_t
MRKHRKPNNSDLFSAVGSFLSANTYNPEGEQYPLRFELREPTPEDFIKTSQEAPSNIDNGNQEFTKLSTQEIEHLQKRLPEIETEKEDFQEFKVREKSLKAPVKGDTILQEFPPKGSFDPPKLSIEEICQDKELIVERYLPEGKVPMAPQLSVTFNDAMVKLSSIEQVESQEIPVEISPKVEGKFRWIGTKSLLFEPKFRFNQSTLYSCVIKKGTKSQNDLKLSKDVKWTFETPTVKITKSLPNATVFESPVFYLHFDQKIEPEKMIKIIKMSNYNGTFELLKIEEVKKIVAEQKASYRQNVDYLMDSSIEGRFMWFRGNKKLKLATNFQVTVGPNIPSAEGPLLAPLASYQFSTFGPMSYVSHSPTEKTLPFRGWSVRFSNKIEVEDLDPEKIVSIEPKLPDCRISVTHDHLNINGKSKGSTDYKITINTGLKDVYGQNLAEKKEITISVGPAEQMIKCLENGLIALDPTEPETQTVSLITCNLSQTRCVVLQVKPSDYRSYSGHSSYDKRTLDKQFNFGKKVFDKVIQIDSKPDVPVETFIPLKQYLQHSDENLGQIVVAFEPLEKDWKNNYDSHPIPSVWIQSTEISLDYFAHSSSAELVCWSNSLRSGKTMEDVRFDYGIEHAKSDKTGLAHFKLSTSDGRFLVASHKNDICFVPKVSVANRPTDHYIASTFNDRNLYKPKEKVSIKGFVRKLKRTKNGYNLESVSLSSFTVKVVDPRGAEYHKSDMTLNEYGSFKITFDVPDNANLGTHYVYFQNTSNHISFSNTFQLQEFRTPEYKVSASTSSGPFIGNGIAIVTVNAEYYSGGGMSSAKANWTVRQSESNYRPVGWNGFNFQKSVPYWFSSPSSKSDKRGPVPISGTTDSNGLNKVCIEYFETTRKPKRPVTLTASVNVQDLNNQVMSANTNVLIHPSSLYVGMKAVKTFGKPNQPIPISLIATNIKGITKQNVAIKLKAYQHLSYYKKLQYVEEQKEVLDIVLKSKNQAIDYDLVLKEGGCYSIIAEVQDENGLINETGIMIIVQGGKKIGTQLSRIQSDSLIVIADKTEYQPGDTATVFVQSPYEDQAEGLMHIVTSGILVEQRFQLDQGSSILKIPIQKEMIPGCELHINLVSSNYRVDQFNCEDKDAPKKPAYGHGRLRLNVPPSHFGLTIQCEPEKKVCAPGSENEVDCVVKDKSGNLVKNAEVTVVVVDEAVLSLTDYRIQDLLYIFHPQHIFDIYSTNSLRSQVYIKDYSSITFTEKQPQKKLLFRRNMVQSSAIPESRDVLSFSMMETKKKRNKSKKEEESSGSIEDTPDSKIENRTNFCPLAVFESVVTDKDGKGKIKFTLPDNLTTYRVTAIAVSGENYYGLAESSIQVNLPIMIRPSPPRFLNFGDKAEIAVILQNQAEVALTVNFSVRMTNLSLTSNENEHLKVKIEPSNRVIVKYPVTTEKCGTGRIQIGAEVLGTPFADAVTKEFPIFTPATTEAFATYGEIDDGSTCQPILPPKDVYSQFGGLEITTSSTAVQALTDAFIYVYYYQFDCVEQASSRLLSICALENVLYAFQVPGLPTKSHLKKIMSTCITKLRNSQRSDGTYGFWTTNSEPNIFLSIHAAHALIRSSQQEYDVPYHTMEKCKSFLTSIETHLQNTYYQYYSEVTKYSLRNFALYVLTLMKHDKSFILKKANDLMKEAGFEKLSMDGLAWILVAINYSDPKPTSNEYYQKILKYFQNRVIETPETAGFTTSYGENNDAQLVMLHSNRRTDAIILDALIEVDPKNSLIPKIVKGLMKHKKNGKWGSTSENCFILLAMKKYFDVYENVTPDFVARMWLGDDFAGEQEFKGRSTDKNLINIPMKLITKDSQEKNVIIQKEGKGRLYYRIGMSYAPKNLQLPALNYGFIVERTYEAVSDPSHVKLNKDGTWTFKEGELVRVRLTMANTSVRYHVALVDFLPAGLEALNPDLPIGGDIPMDNTDCTTSKFGIGRRYRRWRSTWYEHQNFRDERVEAFASYLYCSVHKYSYLARATTKGSFVVPPTKAEEMYSPEVFGRSKTEHVTIE